MQTCFNRLRTGCCQDSELYSTSSIVRQGSLASATSTGRHSAVGSLLTCLCCCLDRRGLRDDHRLSRGLHLLQRHNVLHSVLHGRLLLFRGALVQVRPRLGRHVHLLCPRPGARSRKYSTYSNRSLYKHSSFGKRKFLRYDFFV